MQKKKTKNKKQKKHITYEFFAKYATYVSKIFFK